LLHQENFLTCSRWCACSFSFILVKSPAPASPDIPEAACAGNDSYRPPAAKLCAAAWPPAKAKAQQVMLKHSIGAEGNKTEDCCCKKDEIKGLHLEKRYNRNPQLFR
jgi:hypothetical protein